MGMSYLTSVNPQLFKNVAYVGSFEHFSVQFFYMHFATRPRPALTAVMRDRSLLVPNVANVFGDCL